MREYMVMIHPWNTRNCYVKERKFFLEQGGGKEKWGKSWKVVKVKKHARGEDEIEAARKLGLSTYPKGTYHGL